MMNGLFCFSRFLKVFRKDIVEGGRQNWSLPLIFICIYVLLWVLNTFAIGKVTTVEGRNDYFMLTLAVFCVTIPSALYKRVNDRVDGIWFALLPASKLEKYSVMLLVSTVLWPVGYLLFQAVIDLLLSLIGGPGWGYTGNIFKEPSFACEDMTFLLMCTTFFTCGNLLFRTRKVGKTLIIALTLFLIVGMIKRICPEPTVNDTERILPLIATPVLWMIGYGLFCRIEY